MSYGKTLWTQQSSIILQLRLLRKGYRGSFRLSGYVVESTIGQCRCKAGDKDKFRKGVFYPILDHVNAEMKRRFSKTNCNIMRGKQALNPKSKSFLSEEAVLSLASLYECDLDDLKHELYQTRKVVQKKAQWSSPLLLNHTKKCFISFSACVG